MRIRYEDVGLAKIEVEGDQIHLRWPGFTVTMSRRDAGWLATNLEKAERESRPGRDWSGVDADKAAFGGVYGQ